MNNTPFVFDGFEPANTTPVPDVLFDVLLPHLNEAQLKVMLYIIRRTLGFKKTSDAISLKQFRWGITTREGKKLDDGCGLKNFTTITTALKYLEQIGCIKSEKIKTPEGDQATTVYRIHFRGTTPNVVPTTPNVVGVLRQVEDRTTPNGVRVLRKTYSQETVLQDTVLQDTYIAADTHPEPATPSGVEAHAPLSTDQQEQTPLIASDGLQEKMAPKSGARKPRTPVDETLKERIERVYGYFDALAQETSGDATYRYQRTKKATAAITEWLKGTPTEELLREVYLELWKTPVDIRSGFDWKRNMHIHSVLSQYDSRVLAMKAKRHAAQPKQGTLVSQPKPFKPLEDDDDEPLQYRPFPSQIQKARQQSLAAARRA